MTIQEMSAIMDVLTAAYPQYYKNIPDADKFNACCLWAEMFKDDSRQSVSDAVKAFIATDEKGFPPSIGQIKAKIISLSAPGTTALDAWMRVKKALRNSGYSSVEEFEKLDSLTKRAVGSALQLKEWALMEGDTLESVVGSHFQRSYRELSFQCVEREKLPQAVKKQSLGNSRPVLPEV